MCIRDRSTRSAFSWRPPGGELAPDRSVTTGGAEVAERKRKAKVRLEFLAKIYLSQLERGAHFLREH
eukprot:11046441-Alexandrium_andersonii.AAC.1